jgi:hypothetical protein
MKKLNWTFAITWTMILMIGYLFWSWIFSLIF